MRGEDKKEMFTPFKGGFWSRYLITMRPYLLFVSGSAGLVGMSLVKDPEYWIIALVFIAFFFSYGLGQALTDVFQVDTDSISSPYRPMVKGEIRKRDVLMISLGGLLVCVVIMASTNPFIFIPGAIGVIGLATYTFFKKRWWGGPPWNSWIVATLVLDGAMVDRHFDPIHEIGSFTGPASMLIVSMAAVFFAYANFVVTGYFKDISADRSTGYRTVQVKFGWKAGALYGDVLSLLAVICVLAAGYLGGSTRSIIGWAWTVPLMIGMIANFKAQAGIHRIHDESKTYPHILNVVRAFLFYCYSLIMISHPVWVLFLLPLHIGFELVVWRRPERSQI